MSFVEMNMFAPRIWGFDSADTEMRAARQAGWARADLVWERLTEAGCAAHMAGDRQAAQRLLRRAGWMARLFFGAQDLRRATSLANLAILARDDGQGARAETLQKRALSRWMRSDEAVGDLVFRPRSRSSLFHLRMEALHRETFHDNMRKRYRAIAAETGQAMRQLLTEGRPERPICARWRGEKPPVFDDGRKFLAAALLIAEG
ncbi:tetratricopeptide repeat-containing protein [uncultured Roseovarius sp.]|uniref:tetratricopeptide repeat-containing protein n=1 Tax=uncultured Roseovarius sp. TaxID=293344 RepID=UPI00261ECD61|nr:tetratricopeptide repeat-containing protein [uncultured Roseovarius sp.]